MRNATFFTNSSRRETECIPTARLALIGSARAAGFSAFKGHHGHDVVESGLIAVVPIGALRRVGVEVTLVDIRVGCFLVEPIADVVTALADKRNALSGHFWTTLIRLFFFGCRSFPGNFHGFTAVELRSA